jgi:hypothetical protein
MQSESGYFVGATFQAGVLRTGYAFNLTNQRPAGYVAVSSESAPRGDRPEREVATEFLAYPTISGMRLRRTFHTWILNLAPCLGAESGPTGLDRTSTEHFRFTRAYLGLDASVTLFYLIDLYALAAAGWRLDQQRRSRVDSSVILNDASSPMALGEAGVRFFVPSALTSNPEWGVTASIGTEYYATLRSGFFPYLRVGIVAAVSRPTSAEP